MPPRFSSQEGDLSQLMSHHFSQVRCAHFTQNGITVFFAINKFKDCRVYLVQNTEPGKDRFSYDTDLWECKPEFTPSKDYNYLNAVKQTNGICHSIVIAEKHTNPTSSLEDFKYPTNLQYISTTPNSEDWASTKYHIFDSSRPALNAPLIRESIPFRPHNTDHYKYIGSGF